MSSNDRPGIDKAFELTSRERRLVFRMASWSQYASCQYASDVSFTAERTNSASKNMELEAAAKAVCARCPVRMNCLEHAMYMPEVGGIWGGLNDAERDELAKKLRIDRWS